MNSELDERYAEMYLPGGLAFAEDQAMPWLADYECRCCGQIGIHSLGCPNEHEGVVMKECKVDGCEKLAAAAKGPYGLLCQQHAAEKKQARQSVEPEVQQDLSTALIGQIPPSERIVVDETTRELLDPPEIDRSARMTVASDVPEIVRAAQKVADAEAVLATAREWYEVCLDELREWVALAGGQVVA